ncbi:MAG TPA: dienelactone hydrolase family protein [Solirubrobacteraceae bacterium]|jgi:carboxymethylenebutenolidase
MRAQTIDIETPDGIADAYLAVPEDGERHAGVLFIMDAFGLRPQIEGMVERIAERGFAVLAPNVFYRAGRAPVMAMPDLSDPTQRGAFIETIMPLMAGLTPELIARDAGPYIEVLESAGRSPIAVVGYCMGGRVGWHIATAFPDRVAALAAFHTGGLVTDSDDSPHSKADRLRAEVYLGHADNDDHMTPEHIAALEQALEDAGVVHRSELYRGAAHGYTMADTPVYDEAAAERHFEELFALLDRTVAA